MTVAEFFCRGLAAGGVTTLWGLPGTTTLAALDAVHRHGRLRFVVCRHEQGPRIWPSRRPTRAAARRRRQRGAVARRPRGLARDARAECLRRAYRYWTWTALPRRAFALDVLRCPRCTERMQLIATIDDPAVIQRLLSYLGLPGARDGPPPPAAVSPARAEQRALSYVPT